MKKIVFRKINQKDILIIDNNYSKLSFKNISFENIKLNEFNLFCIKTIFKNIFKNFFKLSLNDIYLKSLIDSYNPKIIIGQNLEGYIFRIKNLCKNIFCIVYQHSFFYECEKETYKKLYSGKKCDLFISYSKDDTKFLSKLIEAEYISLGSIKNNEIILNKSENKEIPLLLISEHRKSPSKLHLEQKIKLCEYIREFSKSKNIVPCVALSAIRDDKKKYRRLDQEIDFYKKYLINFNWRNENSFKTAGKSNLIICLSSNMGIEVLSRGYKTVFFNLIGDKDKDQVNPYLIKNRPKYFFSNLNKETIKNRLNYYFDLKIKNWLLESNFTENSIPFDEGNSKFKKIVNEIASIKNENK